MKQLVVEKANQPIETWPWDDASRRMFKLDEYDVITLEKGGVVWVGTTGISLEEEEE